LTVVIVALVAALAVAALVDAIRCGGGDSGPAVTGAAEADELRGPDVPAPGALPGKLVLTHAGDCRVRQIDFASTAYLQPGPETLCEAWASPTGAYAVVETDRTSTPGAHEIALVRLGDPPEVERELGVARGTVAWSGDGARVAWCGPDGETTVLTVGSGEQATLPGCRPRFAPDGSVLTLSSGSEILRDGAVDLDSAAVAQGFTRATTGPIDVLEFDVAADGLIAVTASRPSSTGVEVVLELWREGQLQQQAELPARVGLSGNRLGALLRFGPDGRELAVGFGGGPGPLTIVDLRTGRLSLRFAQQHAFAWSPDGAWLALATGPSEVQVYGAVRDDPAYTLPVDAATLDWTREQEPPAGA
jgi:hypothetical protein